MKQPIFVVDDERESRVSTTTLLRACGFEVRPFLFGADFLGSLSELQAGVVLLRLVRSSTQSLELLSNIRRRGVHWPVIVLADEIGVSEAVAAMKLGASDIVERAAEVQVLVDALATAGEELAASLVTADRTARSRALIGALSARELEVLRALLAGYTNNRIASLCNISVRTVEMHRANLLHRLEVDSIVGAVRVALEAGVEPLRADAA